MIADGPEITTNTLEGLIHRADGQLRKKKLLSLMIQVATAAHFGQSDRGGHPYILHCLHVGMQQPTLEGKIIGIGHDLFEDTTVRAQHLLDHGFNQTIIRSITELTTQPGETSESAAMRIKQSPYRDTIIPIKLADNRHNQDLTRLAWYDAKDEERVRRYKYIEEFLLHPTAHRLDPFQDKCHDHQHVQSHGPSGIASHSPHT